LDQDYTGEIRVVVCYDERTRDKTIDVINSLSKISSEKRNIEVVRHVPLGPFRALQSCGFENSKGDFVFLLDYDDYYPKNYIRAVVERSVAKGATFTFVKAMKVDERGNELGILVRIPEDPYDIQSIIKANYVGTSAIALHVECLNRIKTLLRNIDHPYYDWIFEDWLIALLAMKHCKPLYIDDVAIYYRIHGKNITAGSSNFDKDMLNAEREFKTLLAYYIIERDRLSKEELKILRKRVLRTLIYICRVISRYNPELASIGVAASEAARIPYALIRKVIRSMIKSL
jgi:glycosyltransferase involved in cell wall biosynthesis